MEDLPRDRLRELLDAVLDDDHPTLSAMADGALSSPFHLSRLVTRHAGEPPVALRRRVLLERAAWRLQRGTSVTDVAWECGYESVEGFSRAFTRAFGHPPSAMPSPTERGHWLPSPNGVHFHGPTVLYVDAAHGVEELGAGDVTALLVRHDLDDVRTLIDLAVGLDDHAYRQVRLPGSRAIAWDGPDESIAEVLRHLVLARVPWLATVEGRDEPDLSADDVVSLAAVHDDLAPRWLAWVRDVERRHAWSDRVVDALCDPPESFQLGQVLAHVLTFSAHRRQLCRWMLQDAGVTVDADPDPIMWHRRVGGLA